MEKFWGMTDGIVENIEADQSYYMAKVNHVDRRHFDRNLENIAPCEPTTFSLDDESDAYCSLFLHPVHGFQWDKQMISLQHMGPWGADDIQHTGKGSEFDDDA